MKLTGFTKIKNGETVLAKANGNPRLFNTEKEADEAAGDLVPDGWMVHVRKYRKAVFYVCVDPTTKWF